MDELMESLLGAHREWRQMRRGVQRMAWWVTSLEGTFGEEGLVSPASALVGGLRQRMVLDLWRVLGELEPEEEGDD